MVRYWCMRYEAKHNYFKDLANKTKCFKNICKSLAYRHQYLVCYQTFSPQSVVKDMQIRRRVLLSIGIVKLHCMIIDAHRYRNLR